jgi:ATP-dependent Clp protease ATP-binding subunit ClpC
MGFSSQGNTGLSDKEIRSRVESELKKLFRPEFLNRVDEIVVFKSLTSEQLRGIVDLMVRELRNRLIAQGMSIELTDAARDFIAREGTDPVYGARPLRRAIQTLIEDPLSEELLMGKWSAGSIVNVDSDGEQIIFTKGEGEIPKIEERTHMELPRARDRWTSGGGTPRISASGDSASSAD